MAGIADLFGMGGGGMFGGGGLYGDLLTPQQQQALAQRSLMGFLAGMQKSGALDYTAPFISGRVPAGFAAGLAGGVAGMGQAQDEGALHALKATQIAQQGQQLKSEMALKQALMKALGLDGSSASPVDPVVPSAPQELADPAPPVPSVRSGDSLGGGMTAGGALAGDPLDLIAKYESGGRNIMQQAVPAGGGYNPSVGRVTGPSTAQGPWQITNTTWRETAPKAGVDVAAYPTAMSAPVEVQRLVAKTLFEEQGFKPWAPYNPRLAAAIKNGEAPPGDVAIAPAPVAPPAIPQAPPQRPNMMGSVNLNDPKQIMRLGILGDLAKIPSIGNLLTASPQYRAAVTAAEEAARLGFAEPKAFAEGSGRGKAEEIYRPRLESALTPILTDREQKKAEIDRITKLLEADLARRNAFAKEGLIEDRGGVIGQIPGFAGAAAATTGAIESAKPTPAQKELPILLGGTPEEKAAYREIKKFESPQTTINNVTDPIAAGVGKSFVEQREAAINAAKSIDSIHRARGFVDQGMISGPGAAPRAVLARVGELFGIPAEAAANTAAFKSAIGEGVLALVRGLGAGSGISDADRQFAERIAGGQEDLGENAIRKILDIREKAERAKIKAYSEQAARLLGQAPENIKGIAPLLDVPEPPPYQRPQGGPDASGVITTPYGTIREVK